MKNRDLLFCGLIFIVLFSFSSCNDEMKFEKTAWSAMSDPGIPPEIRAKMLKDLTTNHKLIGLTYAQLIDSIGEPGYKEDSILGYDIIVDYGSDIDPVYVKTLRFKISKDSVVTSFEVYEWKQ